MSTPPDDSAMYTAVATRRMQWDSLLWQVPAVSLSGQAFLFTIALGPDTSRFARSVACLLSFVMTLLSVLLLAKHRQAELTDAEWLEKYELARFGRSWHGKVWAEQRKRETRAGVLSRGNAFRVWRAGLWAFGGAAWVVFVAVLANPGLLG